LLKTIIDYDVVYNCTYIKEKINPFLTRSEQLAEAFIRIKSNAILKQNENRSNKVETTNLTFSDIKSVYKNMEECQIVLEQLQNDLKVLQITEKSLGDSDTEDRIIIEEQKKQLNRDINILKVEMITLSASIEDMTQM